jgi:DegV family protein with EDD domain
MGINKIQISIDSVCDLTPEFTTKNNIPIFPLMINLGDDSLKDGAGIAEKIYAFADKTKTTPKTAARGIEEYKEFFIQHKPENGALIHFVISAELSASYQNAQKASEELENVFVIDSRSLSTGVGVQVVYALDLAQRGLPPEEIVKKVNARRGEVQCSFITKNLTYLHRGGRCSGTTRFIATALAIRPQIVMNDGRMLPGKKYIGTFDHCVKKYLDDVLNEFDNPDLECCFVTHTRMDNPKMVADIKAQVAARYNFQSIIETVAGGTITSHCGPNTIGVLYYNKRP